VVGRWAPMDLPLLFRPPARRLAFCMEIRARRCPSTIGYLESTLRRRYFFAKVGPELRAAGSAWRFLISPHAKQIAIGQVLLGTGLAFMRRYGSGRRRTAPRWMQRGRLGMKLSAKKRVTGMYLYHTTTKFLISTHTSTILSPITHTLLYSPFPNLSSHVALNPAVTIQR